MNMNTVLQMHVSTSGGTERHRVTSSKRIALNTAENIRSCNPSCSHMAASVGHQFFTALNRALSSLHSAFMPNQRSVRAISVAITAGEYRDYWCFHASCAQ